MARRTFSYAYSKFVPDPNSDVIGLIAYSLYKRDKAAEIQRRVQDGKGEPTEGDLLSWSNHYSTDDKVKQYKVLARKVAQRIIDSEIETVHRPRLRKEIESETVGLIRTDVNKLIGSPGFWGGVATSLGGAVVWVVVTTAIVVSSTARMPWQRTNPESPAAQPQPRLEGAEQPKVN